MGNPSIFPRPNPLAYCQIDNARQAAGGNAPPGRLSYVYTDRAAEASGITTVKPYFRASY